MYIQAGFISIRYYYSVIYIYIYGIQFNQVDDKYYLVLQCIFKIYDFSIQLLRDVYIHIEDTHLLGHKQKKKYMDQGGSDPIIMNLRPWRSFKPSMVIDYILYTD